jgi:RND family efflux transporter MFP subunit
LVKPDLKKWLPWLASSVALTLTAYALAPDLIGFSPSTDEADATPPPAKFEFSAPSSQPASQADLSLPSLKTDKAEPVARRPSAAAGLAPFNCMIEPWEVVEVGSALTAVIESIAVQRGDIVEKGQVLAQLDSKPEISALVVARARATMRGDIERPEASLELGNQKRDRALRLFEKGVVSADVKEEIETEAEVARATLLQAKERKQLMGLEYREAEYRLAQRTIRSPISGVVVERLKSPGEVVKEETILTLARLDPLRVQVIFPGAMFGSIQKGMQAEVEPELSDVGVRIATVTVADPIVDASSGTFGVRLELPNADRSIPSGLHCQVRFLETE